MSITTLTHKRTFRLAGDFVVVVVFCYLAFPFVQFAVNYGVRYVRGSIPHPFGGSPIHDAAHTPLPSVVVEPGPMLCCRMLVCDFRFPLPKRADIATIDSVSGGGDRIKGAIYVTNISGGQIDLRGYGRLLHQAGFRVSDTADKGEIFASSPDGGALEIDGRQPTKIAFSFFGDY